MTKTKKISYFKGILAEKLVIIFLLFKGYKILKWRYRNIFGEIDIIAQKSQLIVAIEVKYRKNPAKNEILSQKQALKLQKSLNFFISKNPHLQKHKLAIDFACVSNFFHLKYYKNFIS